MRVYERFIVLQGFVSPQKQIIEETSNAWRVQDFITEDELKWDKQQLLERSK